MADSKAQYSSEARRYNRIIRHGNMLDAVRYAKSKERERIYNEDWKKHSVNLNDVVKQFTPGAKGKVNGVKFQYTNSKYIVKADMASGYLRIYDKSIKAYVKLDGTPGSLEETHFKILKRSEM